MRDELLTNAITHAVPGERGGHVLLTLEHLDEHEARLTVTDEGIGVSPTLDPQHAITMGLRLVAAPAKQFGGTIEFTSDRGTTARLTFLTKTVAKNDVEEMIH